MLPYCTRRRVTGRNETKRVHFFLDAHILAMIKQVDSRFIRISHTSPTFTPVQLVVPCVGKLFTFGFFFNSLILTHFELNIVLTIHNSK